MYRFWVNFYDKNSIFKGADGHSMQNPASLLTCIPIKQTVGDNISSGGISVDQIIARIADTFFTFFGIWPR